MTCEWKIRRQMFYSYNQEWTDNVDDQKDQIIIKHSNIVNDAVDYFKFQQNKMIYPSKSYSVAIAYSYWLSSSFGGNIHDYLVDEELLFDDPFYVKYEDDKNNYDKIISHIEKGGPFLEQFPLYGPKFSGLNNLNKTREYFLDEFLLSDKWKELLP